MEKQKPSQKGKFVVFNNYSITPGQQKKATKNDDTKKKDLLKCKFCGKDIPNEDVYTHSLDKNCANFNKEGLKNENGWGVQKRGNFLRCKGCKILVPSDDFADHINECQNVEEVTFQTQNKQCQMCKIWVLASGYVNHKKDCKSQPQEKETLVECKLCGCSVSDKNMQIHLKFCQATSKQKRDGSGRNIRRKIEDPESFESNFKKKKQNKVLQNPKSKPKFDKCKVCNALVSTEAMNVHTDFYHSDRLSNLKAGKEKPEKPKEISNDFKSLFDLPDIYKYPRRVEVEETNGQAIMEEVIEEAQEVQFIFDNCIFCNELVSVDEINTH